MCSDVMCNQLCYFRLINAVDLSRLLLKSWHVTPRETPLTHCTARMFTFVLRRDAPQLNYFDHFHSCWLLITRFLANSVLLQNPGMQ